MLIDRLIYMRELGHDAALLPLFDPSLSPRSYALVAIKSDGSDGSDGGQMGADDADGMPSSLGRCWPCEDPTDERWADALWN